MEGWWMVHTTVRPVLTVLRTVRMTIAAALASSPAQCQLMWCQVSIVMCVVHMTSSLPSRKALGLEHLRGLEHKD